MARFPGGAFDRILKRCPEAAADRNESQRFNLQNRAEAQLGLCAGNNHSMRPRIGAPSGRSETGPTLYLFSQAVQRSSDSNFLVVPLARSKYAHISRNIN